MKLDKMNQESMNIRSLDSHRATAKSRIAVVCGLLSIASLPCGATVIITDTFGGSSADPLNGKTASTFSPAVAAAGGSATWVSNSTEYKANGSIVDNPSVNLSNAGDVVKLALGDYIWDARGTESGLFVLTTTFSNLTGGTWVSTGFFRSNANDHFANGNAGGPGMATAIARTTDGTTGTNYFRGTGNGGSSDPGEISGTVTFTISIDLRTWNGDGDWGSVTFSNDQIVGSTTVAFTDDNDDNRFQYVGFSRFGNASVDITNFTLTQVPEVSTAGLGLVSLLPLLRRRRNLKLS